MEKSEGIRVELTTSHGEFFSGDLVTKTKETVVIRRFGERIELRLSSIDRISSPEASGITWLEGLPSTTEAQVMPLKEREGSTESIPPGAAGETAAESEASEAVKTLIVPKEGGPAPKPGDIIDLSKFQTKKHSTFKEKKEKETKLHDFSDLYSLSSYAAEGNPAEFSDEKSKGLRLRPTGKIVQYKPGQFGFVDTPSKERLWMGCENIIDKELTELLAEMDFFGRFSAKSPEVIFTRGMNHLGPIALNVHLPMTLESLGKLVLDTGNALYLSARENLVNLGLEQYPNNPYLLGLKKELRGNAALYRQNASKHLAALSGSEYAQASQMRLTNQEEALRLYKLALEKKQNVLGCIKGMLLVYGALYNAADNAKKLSLQAESQAFAYKFEEYLVSKDARAYYTLESFYYSVDCYSDFIRAVEQLLQQPEFRTKNKQWSTYSLKRALGYMKLHKIADAKDILADIIHNDPDNLAAQSYLDRLKENPDMMLEKDMPEIDMANSGITNPFIQETIENFSDFSMFKGEEALEAKKGNYTPDMLKALEAKLKDSSNQIPKQRATLLLAKLKLQDALKVGDAADTSHSISLYCRSWAQALLQEDAPMDAVRFFYILGIQQAEDPADKLNFLLYIASYAGKSSILFDVIRRGVNGTRDLPEMFQYSVEAQRDKADVLWNGVLDLCITCNIKPAVLFYDIQKLSDAVFDSSLDFLADLLHYELQESLNTKEYNELWEKAIEIRRIQSRSWQTRTRLADVTSFTALAGQIAPTIQNLQKEAWLTSLDRDMMNQLDYDLVRSIQTYANQTSYRDKDQSYHALIRIINNLIDDIKRHPTHLLYSYIIPMLRHIRSLVDESFEEITKASSPKLTLSIAAEQCVVQEDRIVPFQVAVSSTKESSPVTQIHLSVMEQEGIELLPESDVEYMDTLDGGESVTQKLKVQISEDVEKEQALSVRIHCTYTKKGTEEAEEQEANLPLRLYNSNEFEEVDNRYAPFSNGGPIKPESGMFYGRRQFIEQYTKSLLSTENKQIIIYGQKRSGKSSVLNSLRSSLEETGKAFCVLFSIGDILDSIERFGATAVFHAILRRIQERMEDDPEIELDTEDFDVPKLRDFNEESDGDDAQLFRRYLKQFRRMAEENEALKDKKLVVMIDEFTYVYDRIKRGEISENFMKQWKAVTQDSDLQMSVVFVGQDSVPAFKKEAYAANAFGVIEDVRLTYLDEESARKLIEEPVQMINPETGKAASRYVGKAVDKILDYTACSPYYIQIFCDRMVQYMNKNKIKMVTEADVEEVATSFKTGSQALQEVNFDNLLHPGDDGGQHEYSDADVKNILYQIATLGRTSGGRCNINSIKLAGKPEDLRGGIIEDLLSREVISMDDKENCKIQVGLFRDWITFHPDINRV